MDILNDLKRKIKGSKGRLKEEAIYSAVMKEMKAGLKSDGLWGQAIAETEGNEKKAKALYIKLRVQALKDEINIYQKQQDQLSSRKKQLAEERKYQLEVKKEKDQARKKAQEEEKQRKYEEKVIHKFNQEYSFLRRKLPGAWFFISMLIALELKKLSMLNLLIPFSFTSFKKFMIISVSILLLQIFSSCWNSVYLFLINKKSNIYISSKSSIQA